MRGGRDSCLLRVVTAADRAAVTYAEGENAKGSVFLQEMPSSSLLPKSGWNRLVCSFDGSPHARWARFLTCCQPLPSSGLDIPYTSPVAMLT